MLKRILQFFVYVVTIQLVMAAVSSAAPVIHTIPDDGTPHAGQTVTFSVYVDLSDQDDLLGAYSFELNWNPLILDYTGVVESAFDFVIPNVNEENVADGSLLINAFNPSGVGGNVRVAHVVFTVEGSHDETGSLAVQVSSLVAALTFENLAPGVTVQAVAITIDDQCTLQMQVNHSGYGTTTPAVGTHTYPSGTMVNISADPSPGYQFMGWTGDVTNPGSVSTTITINDDEIVTANFSLIPIQYQLSIGVSGQGTTIPAIGAHTYASGTVVYLTADPASGYHFLGWTGAVANPDDPTTTITMNGNKSVTANFAITQYVLTVQKSGEGTVTPAVGPHTYDSGEVVNLIAAPADDYEFVGWDGVVADPDDPTTTVRMSSNRTVTANFALIEYELTIGVTGEGTVDPEAGTHTYTSGEAVNISATPAANYRFVNWTGDVADPNSAETAIVMNGDETVTANFALIEYELTIGVTGEGTVDPAVGTYTYTSGTDVNLSVTPGEGYVFANWTGDVADPNSATTTVTMDSDETVTANFAHINHTLGISVDPAAGGATTPTAGDHEYDWGTPVSVTVTPASGYRFLGWSDWIQSTGPATEAFPMTEDRSLVAHLTPINIWGDVDDSYDVSVVDALKVATYEIDPDNPVIESIHDTIIQRGDVNSNGAVNVIDALICASYELEPDDSYPAGRVGHYLEDVAKPAADPASPARAMIAVNVTHEGDLFGLVSVVTADTGGAIGAAAIHLSWDTSSFRYEGLGENNGSIVGLADIENGEIKFSRYNVAGEASFIFPEVILTRLSDTVNPIEVNVLSAALAGTYQELIPESTVSVEDNTAPQAFVLRQNVPNPFNPSTTIGYVTPGYDHIRIDVYSPQGQRIRTLVDRVEAPGEHMVVWDGRNDAGNVVGSGVYVYRLQHTQGVIHKRMALIR